MRQLSLIDANEEKQPCRGCRHSLALESIGLGTRDREVKESIESEQMGCEEGVQVALNHAIATVSS